MQVTGDGIITAIANAGVLSWFAAKYIGKVDKQSEALPTIVATLDAIQQNIQANTENQKEIFERLRHAETNIERVSTAHDTLMEMSGCPAIALDRRKHDKQD